MILVYWSSESFASDSEDFNTLTAIMWSDKAYLPLISLSILSLIVGWVISYLWFNQSAVDIAMHDTYYVISVFHVFIMISIYTIVQALLYFIINKLKRKLYKSLSIIHSGLILLFLGSVIFLILKAFSSKTTSYYQENNSDEFLSQFILVLFFLTPAIGLVNVFLSKKA